MNAQNFMIDCEMKKNEGTKTSLEMKVLTYPIHTFTHKTQPIVNFQHSDNHSYQFV
jgi:hypothetical protein